MADLFPPGQAAFYNQRRPNPPPGFGPRQVMSPTHNLLRASFTYIDQNIHRQRDAEEASARRVMFEAQLEFEASQLGTASRPKIWPPKISDRKKQPFSNHFARICATRGLEHLIPARSCLFYGWAGVQLASGFKKTGPSRRWDKTKKNRTRQVDPNYPCGTCDFVCDRLDG